MKKRFYAHPLMIFSFLKPFLFVLVIPLLRGAIQYAVYRRVSGILNLEGILLAIILIIAIMRQRAFLLILDGDRLTVRGGAVIKSESVINIKRLSSVTAERSIPDLLFGAVTCHLNTEAGRQGRSDFKFKLKRADAASLTAALYGGEEKRVIRFSAVKIAVMSAAVSSAAMGIIVGVPVINKTGDLLGLALSDMLFDRISDAANQIDAYFPPVVNLITLIFIISYAFSFLVTFAKNVNFRLLVGREDIEIRTGLFVRRRISFKKRCVNDVCIEQNPIMRFFNMFSLRASVGGYGDGRGEKATIVPCGKHKDIKDRFKEYFPYLSGHGTALHAQKGKRQLMRFLWPAFVWGGAVAAATASLMLLFPYFDRLVLFLGLVCEAIIFYYGCVCYHNYRFGKIALGESIFVKGSDRFNFRELYCERGRVGYIKLLQTPADRRYGSCKIKLVVRSESADTVKVRNIDYNDTLKEIENCFNIKGISAQNP